MEKIDNHNCVGVCSQRFCDKPESCFLNFSIHGLEIVVSFCAKHSEEFEDRINDEMIKRNEARGVRSVCR